MMLRHRQLRLVHLQPRAVSRRARRRGARRPQRRGDGRGGGRPRTGADRHLAGARTARGRRHHDGGGAAGSANGRRSSACAWATRPSAPRSAGTSFAPACRCTGRRRSSSTTAAACSAASAKPFAASRYHSLVVSEEGLPADLEVTARTRGDRIIMGLRHRRWPVHGVQFHPESILTGEGHKLLRNFLEGEARLAMFAALIDKLTRHEDLTSDEAAAAMTEVMEGRAAPAQVAGLLIGLAMKGERPTEIVGLARAMRAHAVQISRRYDRVFDTCGTGGDRSGTFNISSCAALVIAACGVRVAKHGNRSVSSLSGSADVFEALGVRVTASPAVVERCLAEAGIGFFFAPTFHPSMRHAAKTRARPRRADGVQPARPAHEPGRRHAPAGRRPAAGADGADGPVADAARVRARVGRPRRGRHRRDLDGRLHEGVGGAGRIGQHVLPAPGRRRPAQGEPRRAQRRRRARKRPHHRADSRRASGEPRATSCC